MPPETTINFIVGAKELIIGIVVFFLGLLAVIWKGKGEISEAIKEETGPLKRVVLGMTHALIEIQRIFEDSGVSLKHHI
ncbi:hypothetical protein L0Y46_00290, partial [bacterium]|nr:hypothetical protein [bacterium]